MPAAMRRLFGTPVPLTTEGRARPGACRLVLHGDRGRRALEVELLPVDPVDRAARHPREPGRDALELEHEPDRRRAAADDHDVPVAEVLGGDEVGRVHVPAREFAHARVEGDERRPPRAGGVHEEARGDLVLRRALVRGCLEALATAAEQSPALQLLDRLRREVFVAYDQVGALIHDRADVDRPVDAKLVVLLEPAVVVGDDLFRREVAVGGVEAQAELGHAGQVVHTVRGAETQRRPAMLPGAARTRRAVEHDEVLVGDELEAAQVIGHRQSRLSCADHHDLHAFRGGYHLTISTRVAECAQHDSHT